jgi:hypothetical protein
MEAKMKKKSYIIVALAILIAFSLAACGGSDEPAGDGSGAAATEAADGQSDEGASGDADKEDGGKSNDSGELGDYAYAIKDFSLVKDWEGKDAILVNIDFTNNSEEGASYDWSCMSKAFQDGVELGTTFLSGDDELYNENGSKEIKPGVTIDVTSVFQLDNPDSPVEVELSEIISFDDKMLTKTFEIK